MNTWPTPARSCVTGAGAHGRDGGLNLQTATALWPTPKGSAANYGQPRENDRGDLQAATGLWQTPRCAVASFYAERDETLKARGREGLDTLPRPAEAASARWASPQSRDWKSGAVSAATLAKNSRPLNEQVVSLQGLETPPAGSDTSNGSPRLNPAFVCLLMGLPPGWVDLE